MAVRRGKKLPDVLTEGEQEALMEATGHRSPTALRDKALLVVMLNEGKGGKDRFLRLCDADLDLLKSWHRVRGLLPVKSDYLFINLKGGRLSDRYLRYMVKSLAARAGVNGKSVYPHLLRHSFATDLYRETLDLVLVKDALGHEDIATTTIYTQICNERLEEAMRKLREKRHERQTGT
jgi:integrase/recombinase XerD